MSMPWRIATIVVLGFIAFGAMLHAPFKTMDDRFSIVDNPSIKSASHISEIFRQGYFKDQYYYRPLVNLSYMVEYHAFGLNSFFYNLNNLFLHIANALLVFLLIFQLTQNRNFGFWTGVLFVLHPIQWEAVCNIPGRAILMSAFFVLCSFNGFIIFYRQRKWRYLILALIVFIAGLLSKESAGVLPAVLIAYLCLEKDRGWMEKLKDVSPFFAVIVGYVILRHLIGISKVYHSEDIFTTLLGFETFLRSVMTHLRLFIWPVDLHFDRSMAFFTSFQDQQALSAIGFWSVLSTVLFLNYKKIEPIFLFLIFWFAFEIFPVSQIVASIGVGQGWISTADHFLYLAAVPVLAVCVMGLGKMYERKIVSAFIFKGIIGAFLVFLLSISIEQSIYASNEFNMLKRSIEINSHNPRVQASMGLQYVFREDFVEAEKHFQAAVKADPFNPKYRISLGTSLCQQERWVECLGQYVALDDVGDYSKQLEHQKEMAFEHILEDIKNGGNIDGKSWFIVGVYYAKKGLVDEAILSLEKSVNLDASMKDAWLNLGSLYEAKMNWAQAQKAFKRLLAFNELTYFQKSFGQEHLIQVQKHVDIHS